MKNLKFKKISKMEISFEKKIFFIIDNRNMKKLNSLFSNWSQSLPMGFEKIQENG